VESGDEIEFMRILVTGSAGFIGFHLAKRLLEDGHEVIGMDNLNDYYDVRLKAARLAQLTKSNRQFRFYKADLADTQVISNLFREVEPDAVFNLAAQAGVRHSLQAPHVRQEDNMHG